jgi:hypothetical protein
MYDGGGGCTEVIVMFLAVVLAEIKTRLVDNHMPQRFSARCDDATTAPMPRHCE